MEPTFDVSLRHETESVKYHAQKLWDTERRTEIHYEKLDPATQNPSLLFFFSLGGNCSALSVMWPIIIRVERCEKAKNLGKKDNSKKEMAMK